MSVPVDIYVRVSRVGGREHLISPEEQERDARTFAERRGLPVGQVLSDLDRSGGTLERPRLQEALRRVRAGKSRGIVVAYLSRLTRDTSQGLALLEEIRAAGGDVYAPNLSDHTTADGRMLNTIQLAIDAGVRERAKEGLARARERAIEQGIPVTNRVAVGYRRRSDRRLEPDPKTAPVIRQAFERRAAGAGPSEIADLLEARGVRTSQGSRGWSKAAVQQLLKSRTYLGELRSGEFVNPDSHEPLVDQATWNAAQNPRRKLRSPSSGKDGRYTLTGLLRCRACGHVMQGTVTSRGKRIYRCIGRHAGGRCSAPVRIDADRVELGAEEAFWMITRDRKLRAQPEQIDLAPLEDELQRAERRLEQALSPDVQDAAGDAWAAMVATRRAEREAAAEALGRAKAEASTDAEIPDPVKLRSLWDEGTPAERRGLLAIRFDCLALDRDGNLILYPRGTAPESLSRRGFRRSAELQPIAPGGLVDVPASWRVA